jgi:predicted unusual protein kinase regulating ubiquinone biosynthesis (AarF/ABC1/UbiB family)
LTSFESLRRVGIFAELTESEVRTLGEACEELSFQPGDRVIEDGARGLGLFIVLSGAASVLKFAGSQGEIELARLHPGEHFGEMSLVSDRPSSASVRADSALACLFASRQRFDDLLRDNPDIARKVLTSFVTTLSRRLTDIDLHYARVMRKARRQEALRHVVLLSALQWRMLISYAWIWFRRSVLHWPMSAERVSAIHRRYAHRFKQLATRLKGATVKIAQIASLQQALIPPEYIDEFKSLRDQVAPSEYPLVAGRIQAELGASPLEVFSEFSRAPLAAASMGQVHRARLPSGEDVVVKVLHPGVEQSVLIDLWITKSTLWALNWLVPKIDLMQVYRESREPLLEELDLLHEARATEELGKALQPLGVQVPKIHWQYSTRRVLTLEFVAGVTLNNVQQMKAWNVDRVELARTYLRAFLHQALTGGFFHADPHPGNAFCTPEGKLVLLDFGMVKRLPDRVRKGLAKEWMGAFFKNPRMYVDGVIEKGGIGEEDREYLEQQAARVFNDDRLRDLIFDHNTDGGVNASDVVGQFTTILGELKSFKTPQDELMFLRGLGICADVVKEIVPEMKVSEVGEPVYADLFLKVIAENPVYASGPFRLTLRDADLARVLEPRLAEYGFRDLSIACQPGIISAEVRYPLTRFGLGEVRVKVKAAATLVALDAQAQAIDLRITSVDLHEASEPGLLGRLLEMTVTMAQLAAQAPVGKRDFGFSWGKVEFPDGANLPIDAKVNVSALASLGGPYFSDFKLDVFLVEEGRIVIGRGGGAN